MGLVEVELPEPVRCFFCTRIARYDGKTKAGPWAYMCTECFKFRGVGLGLGRGQRITYTGEKAE